MLRRLLPLMLLLAAACSGASRQMTPSRPAIDIYQRTPLFFGSGRTAPLNLAVAITNVAKEPIVIRRVRIQPGPGMTQYSVYPMERIVKETIAPGETREIDLAATAFTNISRLRPTEPLGLRTFIDYQAGDQRHQELYVVIGIGR